jgi:hypothetical protein
MKTLLGLFPVFALVAARRLRCRTRAPTTADAASHDITTPDDAADGASWRVFEDWYDTTRGERCGVQRMSDGKLTARRDAQRPTFTPDSSLAALHVRSGRDDLLRQRRGREQRPRLHALRRARASPADPGHRLRAGRAGDTIGLLYGRPGARLHLTERRST